LLIIEPWSDSLLRIQDVLAIPQLDKEYKQYTIQGFITDFFG